MVLVLVSVSVLVVVEDCGIAVEVVDDEAVILFFEDDIFTFSSKEAVCLVIGGVGVVFVVVAVVETIQINCGALYKFLYFSAQFPKEPIKSDYWFIFIIELLARNLTIYSLKPV